MDVCLTGFLSHTHSNNESNPQILTSHLFNINQLDKIYRIQNNNIK